MDFVNLQKNIQYLDMSYYLNMSAHGCKTCNRTSRDNAGFENFPTINVKKLLHSKFFGILQTEMLNNDCNNHVTHDSNRFSQSIFS